MINNGSKTILVLLSTLFAVILSVLVFGIYEIKAKNAEASRIVNETDQTEEAERIIESLTALQENNATDLRAFDDVVFRDDKLVPLIEEIEGMGRNLALETKIVSVSELEDKKTSEPKLIKIVVETTKGSWSSTLAFIKAVENLPHKVLVDETIITKDGDDWHLRMTISIHAFN